ncbi:MAG: dCTP deaminase [Bacteroidales bacterium]
MILTGEEIKKEVLNNRIHIKPFFSENLNPNSYNYHLGPIILEISDSVVDPKRKSKVKKIKLSSKGFVLRPGRIYLGSTIEEIGSDYYVTTLIGRSSVGRLGLYLQITADLGHMGSKHCWTLELCVVQPLIVYPKMKIGQVSFWEPFGAPLTEKFDGKYQKYCVPKISEMYKNIL